MRVLILVGILFEILSIVKCLRLNLESKEDICHLFPNGAILRKPGSCKETIQCQNGQSIPHFITCTGNEVVSLDKMNCTTTRDDDYCKPSCMKAEQKWIEDKKNCNDWIACDGRTVIKTGSCPKGQVFIQEKQICYYRSHDFICNKSYDVCNLAQIGQKFLDKDNCHKYFVCNKNYKTTTKLCPTSTYYDVRSSTCIKKSQVNCYKHPVPEEVCGNQKLAIHDRFVRDGATCRGFFYCKNLNVNGIQKPDLNPSWGQCPVGYFYSDSDQACRNQNYVKCIEDRCDGISEGKVLSEMSGCQHYLVCKNNSTINEIPCKNNKYFDPITKSCVNRKISYPICDPQ